MINIILNITLGLIIGFLIYLTLNCSNIYKGPNSNIIKKQVFELNGKCYKFVPVVHICPSHIRQN